MPIIASEPKSTFTPAPEGLHAAICCDVIDLGLVESNFGVKPTVKIVWQLEEMNEAGKPYLVSARYTLSLHEKSKLRQHLETWRGRKFTAAELKGFDLEKLVGVNCQVQVIHRPADDGRVWANVAAVIPKAKHAVPLVVIDYVREKDRKSDAPAGNGAHVERDDDDIPF